MMLPRLLPAALLFLVSACPLLAEESLARSSDAYAGLVLQDKPVAYWRLDDAVDGVFANHASGENAAALAGRVVGKV